MKLSENEKSPQPGKREDGEEIKPRLRAYPVHGNRMGGASSIFFQETLYKGRITLWI